ncbi:Methyltransferase domain family protein [Luminiphilus syltensis NOR5-1B]|uniref:Methyltransferase domain family protein n=1 Tax=Luminiphilus syltensis NOR5-1B TaxID=565045 RepID=B8KY06_9GAMM|nr:class I SAM-dependent methyltransferase [Luminiphilus syltensis]EED34672.1 Methyltransferase domain family protein [Luminiphilus syltensis NOR5-1B]
MDFSSGKTHGYVSDEPYTYGYYPEIMPEGILKNVFGRPIRPQENFRYLDLGCGFGVTSSLVAALYPMAEIVQVDLNPAHTDSIRRFNTMAGLENSVVLNRDLLSLEPGELGEFDFVSAQGLLSWISDDVRAAAFSFVCESLKPDALVYLSYLTPKIDPRLIAFRETLYQAFDAAPGGSLQRLRTALDDCLELAGKGSWPNLDKDEAQSLLFYFMQRSPNYLLHEFLNDDWSPIVSRELGEIMMANNLFSRIRHEDTNFQSGYCREIFGKGNINKLLELETATYSYYAECYPGSEPVFFKNEKHWGSAAVNKDPAAGVYIYDVTVPVSLVSRLARYNKAILDSPLSDEKSSRPLAICGAGQGVRLTPVQQEFIRVFLSGQRPTAETCQPHQNRGINNAKELWAMTNGTRELTSSEKYFLEFMIDYIPYGA